MILGITGGTGCGKTTFLRCVENLGGIVIDCDALYHHLLATDENLLLSIEKRFPGTVESGSLNRKKLGSIVFSDPAALLDLNAITHAAVKTAVMEILRQNPGKLTAIDAIGLFEGGLAKLCDTTVAITAPEEMRIQRIMARDDISHDYAQSRVRAQRQNEEFSSLCHHTLVNDSTEEAFHAKCLAFLHTLGIINA